MFFATGNTPDAGGVSLKQGTFPGKAVDERLTINDDL
jgi:hypothetical protein